MQVRVPPEVTRLFAAIDADKLDKRIDRLHRRLKALLPLDATEQRCVIKRLAGRPYRPGFVRADSSLSQLEWTPSGGNRFTSIDDETMTCTAILSTPTPDRVGDVVMPGGVDLSNYNRNPVVLLHHQSDTSLPIGRCDVTIDRVNNRLLGRITFAKDNPQAVQAWKLVKAGMLSAVSIGFAPLSAPVLLPGGGQRFDRWELLEISLVAIPCNPQCLITSF
jgi:HK97 family phage prohead protease